MPIQEEALRAEREKLLLRRAEQAIARKNTQFTGLFGGQMETSCSFCDTMKA